MDPVVRQASQPDLADLARLEILGRDAATQYRGGLLLLRECPPIDWTSILEQPDLHVFVGTLDDLVCAFLVLRLDRDRAVVEQVFVEQEARELGLGDTLVEIALDTARAAHLEGIEATALPGDREMKNLFERAGLTARKLIVYKSLAPSRIDDE